MHVIASISRCPVSMKDAAIQNFTPQLRRCSCACACIALFAGSALFGQQTQFQGSVPTGEASSTPLSLTLRDAIDRGLGTNLGLLLSGQASEAPRVSGCDPSARCCRKLLGR